MRVLHVVRQFSPSVGGLEDSVLNLAREQRRTSSVDAQVVTLNRVFNRQGILAPRESVDGIPVIRIPWRGSTRYPLAPAVLLHLAGADIVHVHAIDFFFDFFALTRPFVRKPLVVSTHGGFFHTAAHARLKKIWFGTITRAATRAYDRVIACSENDADIFSPITDGNLVTIENGISQQKFTSASAPDPRRTLISFGRFSGHKRFDLLFPLLAELRARNPEWTLIVAGRPAEKQLVDLERDAAASGVRDAVRFVLEPSDATLRELMGQASWFVSFSEHEGFGLAAVEALSAGLVPVLGDIAPFRRLVARTGTGLVREAGSGMAQLAGKIELLQEDAGGMKRLRAQAIRGARSYDWKDVARRYVAVYEEVLAGKPAGLPRGASS